MANRFLIYSLSLVLCTTAAFVLNIYMEAVLIPDPCAYHGAEEEGNAVFFLFYELSAGSGGHPQASWFNLFFTLFLGLVVGLRAGRRCYQQVRKRLSLHTGA